MCRSTEKNCLLIEVKIRVFILDSTYKLRSYVVNQSKMGDQAPPCFEAFEKLNNLIR